MDVRLPDNLRVQHFFAHSVTAVDTAVAMRIFYQGPAAADPEAILDPTLSAPLLSLYTNKAGAVRDTYQFVTNAGADHTNTGEINFHTHGVTLTFGALVALINKAPNWKAVLVAALPEDTFYTFHATPGSAVIEVVACATGTAAEACTLSSGAEILFDTTVCGTCQDCIGLENMEGESDWEPIARLQQSTLPKTDRERDVANLPVAGARVFQALNRAAFLTYAYVANTGAGDAVSGDTIDVYAATQTSSRLLRSIAGPGDNANNASTTADLDVPIVTRNGERIVVVYQGTNVGTNVPTMKLSGGVGIVRG